MVLKRLITGMSAAAFGATLLALPAYADEPQADENGVYGTAGVVWMIMDQWDHKKDIDLQPLDEMENNEIASTYHNVNITGNGQYTVDMSGYAPPQDWIDIGVKAGYLGVQIKLDFETYEQLDAVIDSCTIDGVEYTFEKGEDEKGERIQPPLEDPEVIENGCKMLKIKNGYGDCAKTQPEMTDTAWTTDGTISITFTVSGLPTDKVEGFADEVVEQVYEGTPEEPEEEETEESAADEEKAEDGAETEAKDDAKSESKEEAKDEDKDKDDEKSNMPFYIGIGCGVAVVAAVVVVLVMKKK